MSVGMSGGGRAEKYPKVCSGWVSTGKSAGKWLMGYFFMRKCRGGGENVAPAVLRFNVTSLNYYAPAYQSSTIGQCAAEFLTCDSITLHIWSVSAVYNVIKFCIKFRRNRTIRGRVIAI